MNNIIAVLRSDIFLLDKNLFRAYNFFLFLSSFVFYILWVLKVMPDLTLFHLQWANMN